MAATSLWPTVLGGAIALAGVLLAQAVAVWLENKRLAKEDKKEIQTRKRRALGAARLVELELDYVEKFTGVVGEGEGGKSWHEEAKGAPSTKAWEANSGLLAETLDNDLWELIAQAFNRFELLRAYVSSYGHEALDKSDVEWHQDVSRDAHAATEAVRKFAAAQATELPQLAAPEASK